MLLVAGLVALGAVGIALVTTQYENQQDPEENAPVAVVETNTPVSQTGDTDNDGVSDWKEILWSTNPHNADTDGDGISDGDEIAAGTDPLQEGAVALSDKDYEAPKALPPTEALAREFFTNYASARRDGSITQAEMNTAASGAIGGHIRQVEVPEVYTLPDLKVDGGATVEVYSETLGTTLLEANAVREHELSVFARAVNTGSEEELQKILASALIYRSILGDLLATEVPIAVAKEHLAVVNGISELSTATEALSEWSGDPLDALALVNNFAAAEANVSTHLKTLYTFIEVVN